jgi:hypothetical protein
MNSKQNVKLKMYIAVRDFLTKFLSIVSVLPNFEKYFTALKNAITSIQSSSEHQELDNSGTTSSKNDLKKTLARLAADTARKLVAYASSIKNIVLETEINYSESELIKMTDIKLINAAKLIYSRAQENLTVLEPYFVTAATQTAFQTAITNFEKSTATPRVATAESSQSTQQLAQGYIDADKALDDLDKVIDIICLTQVDFYHGYKTVRKQVGPGGSVAAVKVKVTDIAGNPLKGVKVTLTLQVPANTNGRTVITKKTAEKGGILIRNASEGTYDVTAKLPGYKDAATKVSVVSGQMSTLNITMEKA